MNNHHPFMHQDPDNDQNPLGVFAALCAAVIFGIIVWAIIIHSI